MTTLEPETLIEQLRADPERFERDAGAYQLLQCYFHGYPIATLRPLLANADISIKRAAIFIVSELVTDYAQLLDLLVPLVGCEEAYIHHTAMTAVAGVAKNEHATALLHILTQLLSPVQVYRLHAMKLLSTTRDQDLHHASTASSTLPDRRHYVTLSRLFAPTRIEAARSMITDADALIRRYGAIGAARFNTVAPDLAALLAASDDSDLRRFRERLWPPLRTPEAR